MIKIFAKKDEIFLKCKEKIYYFKLIELEKDLEDIIFQCNLDKKEKDLFNTWFWSKWKPILYRHIHFL